MLVIPAPRSASPVLTDLVNQLYAKGASARLHPCHRIDRETSGAVIFAWGKDGQARMMELFHREEIDKTYIAFVRGRVKQARGTINRPVEDVYHKRDPRGARPKPAVSRYEVVEYHRGFSVVEWHPRTGRTHQIRIHSAEMGHPVLGERVYAFRRDFTIDCHRLALHCHRMEWRDPWTGQARTVVSPLADDLKAFLDY